MVLLQQRLGLSDRCISLCALMFQFAALATLLQDSLVRAIGGVLLCCNF